MNSLTTIFFSILLVPMIFSGTIKDQKKKCHCRRSNSFYMNGLCLLSVPCKNNHISTIMLTDRKLGNKIVIYNKKVYRAYPAAPRKSKRCLISSTSYNQKFDLCIRRLKCSEKAFGASNGPVSKKYYIFKNEFYLSYPSYCQ